METKKHYKLYKSRKRWVTMAVATAALTVGAVATTTVANADTTDNGTTTGKTEVAPASTGNSTSQADSTSTSEGTNQSESTANSNSETDKSTGNEGNGSTNKETATETAKGTNTPETPTCTKNDDTDKVVDNDDSTNTGLKSEDGSNYYYVDGIKQINTKITDKTGIYYLSSDGKALTNGFYTDPKDNAVYYFGSDSKALVNQWYYNWGNWYYFDAKGKRLTSTEEMVDGGQAANLDTKWIANSGLYTFNADGVATLKKDAFYTKDGKTYYFDEDGIEYKNQWYSNWGNKYYFGDDGALVTDTTKTIDGATY